MTKIRISVDVCVFINILVAFFRILIINVLEALFFPIPMIPALLLEFLPAPAAFADVTHGGYKDFAIFKFCGKETFIYCILYINFMGIFSETTDENKRYVDARQHIKDAMRDEVPLVLDTNAFVAIANVGDRAALDEMIGYEFFFFMPKNQEEIYGLIKHKKIGPKASQLLTEYFEKLKTKIPEVDFNEFAKEVEQLVELIPRRLVHYILVIADDSLANRLLTQFELVLARLERGESLDAVSGDIKRMNELNLGDLDSKIMERHKIFCEMLKINLQKANKDRYFEHVNDFKGAAIKEICKARDDNLVSMLRSIKSIKKDKRVLLEKMKSDFMKIGEKGYVGDMRLVAEARAVGAKIRSLDKDVIALNDLLGARVA